MAGYFGCLELHKPSGRNGPIVSAKLSSEIEAGLLCLFELSPTEFALTLTLTSLLNQLE